LPSQIQLNVDALVAQRSDRGHLLRDADATLAAIDRRREALQSEYLKSMQELSQQVDGHQASLVAPGYHQQQGDELAQRLVGQLTAEIQELQAQLRAQTFQRDLLTQAVEQAKTARTTLETKVQEASIASATGGGRAIVAAGTTTPLAPSFPPPLSRTLPLVSLLGLIIGLAAVIGLDALSNRRSHEVARQQVPAPAANRRGSTQPATISE
jgi:hypothetical protein